MRIQIIESLYGKDVNILSIPGGLEISEIINSTYLVFKIIEASTDMISTKDKNDNSVYFAMDKVVKITVK